MFLYPYKIFTTSKNKRIVLTSDNMRPVGIYDADVANYSDTEIKANKFDCSISILLGVIAGKTRLICLDLDDCFTEDGQLEAETKEFLKEFSDEEWEISSSATGIHVYILTNMDLETFIVKDIKGVKSFECYTNKRHIVTTDFDFKNTNLKVGVHDEFLSNLYKLIEENKKSTLKQDVEMVFQGEIIKSDRDVRAKVYGRTPIADMYTLRGCGYKDKELISIIDAHPDSVDQSAHDAKLIRKIMYYTLEDFDTAWEFAKKTNYYKAKDAKHKKKFDDPKYKERTRKFLCR